MFARFFIVIGLCSSVAAVAGIESPAPHDANLLPQPRVLAQASTPPAKGARLAAAPAATSATPATPSKPLWSELTKDQKLALAPLQAQWASLRVLQKQKWLSVSARFDSLGEAEQKILHARMAEWASLSPSQRSLARINYGEMRALSAEDKRAAWEAYQALTLDERAQLKLDARPAVASPAISAQPIPRNKLVDVKVAPPASGQKARQRGARIPVGPDHVDPRTLLPTPATIESVEDAATPVQD